MRIILLGLLWAITPDWFGNLIVRYTGKIWTRKQDKHGKPLDYFMQDAMK